MIEPDLNVNIEDFRDELREFILSDTPESFELYFMALYNRPFAPIWRPWVKAMYEAHEGGAQGVLIESFRYSWKTTVLTNAFLSYRIGLEPHKTNMIIQVKDETAEQTAAAVAKIIEQSPVWKWLFPHVVPDPSDNAKGRGWGHKGYYVKRTDVEYGDWIRMCGRDPTFVGYGYTSDSIIGKHPNGVLIIDDIHNETNTASSRELQRVIKILTGTIFPMIDPKQTWVLFVGTPWVAGDALDYVKSTGGGFICVKTTVTVDGKEGGDPSWPEQFDRARIEELKRLVGSIEFSRMYLVNIEAAEGLEFKREWLMEYPYERINPTWPVVFGVDYATLTDPMNASKRDYFALAVGVVIPNGGMVIVDGVYDKMTQAEAELRVEAIARLYPTLQAIGFETLGGGKEMFNIMLRTTNLPLVPLQKGNRNKRDVYHKALVPSFQSGRLRLSDVPNPFIVAFRNEWLTFPAGMHDDALDAVYYCGRAASDFLLDFNAPDREAEQFTLTQQRVPNPWGSWNKLRAQ